MKEWWLTLEMESNNFPDLTMSIFYVKSQTTTPFETCKYFFRETEIIEPFDDYEENEM